VLLDKFINKYVCCSNCHYPEVVFSIKGKKEMIGTCNACGFVRTLDTTHKAGKQMLNEI